MTESDPRTDPPLTGDERSTLEGFLDYHRATLELKCADLDAEQLARRAVPPSTLSLLGLVRHLREVEDTWFARIAGRPHAPRYYSAEDPDGDLDGAAADPALVEDAFTSWRAAVAASRTIAAGVTDLGQTFEHERHGPMSVRATYAHLIEEYARHNGHADLLREAIDGRTGE